MGNIRHTWPLLHPRLALRQEWVIHLKVLLDRHVNLLGRVTLIVIYVVKSVVYRGPSHPRLGFVVDNLVVPYIRTGELVRLFLSETPGARDRVLSCEGHIAPLEQVGSCYLS